MARKCFTEHHIFMLALAGAACLHQRWLRCRLFRSSPCKGRDFTYPAVKYFVLWRITGFIADFFGETPEDFQG